MYYTTYRPKSLSELDTAKIRDQLTAVLSSDRIPHAFLFSGPRGTGKTSTARIVAKILNAEVNQKKIANLNPPEKDPNVIAITQGSSADVVEIDAASNRKIDDVRELIAQLKFSPLVARYKIYIVDEVHMLTKEAFNAFLKSLEEPPAHTIFILATTEPDALPKTILSRCMRINFDKAAHSDIVSMLQRICKGEKLKVDKEALELIATAADGSFRDAAKTLELAALGKDTGAAAIRTLLGSHGRVEELLSFIAQNKTREALTWISAAATDGSDFKFIIENLLSFLHALLLAHYKIKDATPIKIDLSVKQIASLISLLQKAYAQLKITPITSLPLEIAIVEYIAEQEHI